MTRYLTQKNNRQLWRFPITTSGIFILVIGILILGRSYIGHAAVIASGGGGTPATLGVFTPTEHRELNNAGYSDVFLNNLPNPSGNISGAYMTSEQHAAALASGKSEATIKLYQYISSQDQFNNWINNINGSPVAPPPTEADFLDPSASASTPDARASTYHGTQTPSPYTGPLYEGAPTGGSGNTSGNAASVIAAAAGLVGGNLGGLLGGGSASCSSGATGQPVSPAVTQAGARPSGSAAQGASDTHDATALTQAQLDAAIKAGNAGMGNLDDLEARAARGETVPSARTDQQFLDSQSAGYDSSGRPLGPIVGSTIRAQNSEDQAFLNDVNNIKADTSSINPVNSGSITPPRSAALDTTADGYQPTYSTNTGGGNNPSARQSSPQLSTFDKVLNTLTGFAQLQNLTNSNSNSNVSDNTTSSQPQTVSTSPSYDQQIALLLNVIQSMVANLQTVPITSDGDAQFYRGVSIVSASLQKISTLFTVASTQNNRVQIENGLAPMLTDLTIVRAKQSDPTRASTLSDVITIGGALLTQVNNTAVQPSAAQLQAQQLFNQNASAYHAAMQEIYNLTKDTGDGVPLENASRLAAAIKNISDEYAKALDNARKTQNFNSPEFVSAQTKMKILTDNLAQLQAVASAQNFTQSGNTNSAGNSGGSNGGNGLAQIEQIAGVLSGSGILPSDAQRGLQSGLQALSTLSQLRGQGASFGTFANIAQAVSSSGMLSRIDSANLNRAIGAFGAVDGLIHNQNGVVGILQSAVQLKNLFQSNPFGGTSGVVSRLDRSDGGATAGFSDANPEAVAAANKNFGDNADATVKSTDDATTQAKNAGDAGGGTTGALADQNNSGGGAPKSSSPLQQGLDGAGGNRGVPVNVLSGTPYFKLVTTIKDLDQHICTLQQETWDKLTQGDPDAVTQAQQKLGAALDQLHQKFMAGVTDLYGNQDQPIPVRPEDILKAHKDIASAITLDQITKAKMSPEWQDYIQQGFKQATQDDLQGVNYNKLVAPPDFTGSLEEAHSVSDFLDYLGPKRSPIALSLYSQDLQSQNLNEKEQLAVADIAANQNARSSIKCPDGAMLDRGDGTKVCTKPQIDPMNPMPASGHIEAAALANNLDLMGLTDTHTTGDKPKLGRADTAPQEIATGGSGSSAQNPSQTGNNNRNNSANNPSSNDDLISKLLRGLTLACSSISGMHDFCYGSNPQNPATTPPQQAANPPVVVFSSSTSTLNALEVAHLNWTAPGADSCQAGNDWRSFGSGASTSLTPSTLYSSGSTLVAQCTAGVCGQDIYYPNAFAVTVNSPNVVDQGHAFSTSLAIASPIPNRTNGTRVTQTTTYTPTGQFSVGAQITLTINGVSESGTLTNAYLNQSGQIDQSSVVSFIRDMMARVPSSAPEYKTLLGYTFSALGNTLTITGTADSDTQLPDHFDYQISCQNSAGATSDSTSVVFGS